MKKRAAIYVDGFNLYHSVNDLGLNYLKWCNLWKLGEIILPSKDEDLVRAVFCTAFYPGDQGKSIRHRRYNDALRAVGVEIVLGNYIQIPACPKCSHGQTVPSEKETDINLALSVFNDARHDRFDHAYIVSADSDQAATFRMMKAEFPEKKVTTVSPPGRNFSVSILRYTKNKIQLNFDHIDKAAFDKLVIGSAGAVLRPQEYDPPPGWVHPSQRPAKNKP